MATCDNARSDLDSGLRYMRMRYMSFFAGIAVAVLFAFFVASCLMAIGARSKAKKAESLIESAEKRHDSFDAAMADVRSELERRKESHERVVAVLIEERDRWRDQARKVEESFDGTVWVYQQTIGRLSSSKGRQMTEQEILDIVSAHAKFVDEVKKMRSMPETTKEKAEADAGYVAKERRALWPSATQRCRTAGSDSTRRRTSS